LVKREFTYWWLFGSLMILTLLMAGSAQCQQDDISINLSLDRDKIGMNETATLTVQVSGSGQKQFPEPKLPPLPQFQVFSSGSSTNLQIVNGVVNSSVTYNYVLSPKREGTFPIRAATMLIDGERYESNELSITVVKSAEEAAGNELDAAVSDTGETKDIFLVTEVDKKTAYVDEQVTLYVKFYHAVKILSSMDYTPPQMSGFWTNDIPPQKQYYQIIKGRRYLVNELRTALFPTKPGELTISPAYVSVTVPDRSRRRSRDPFSFFDGIFEEGKRVQLKSRPITVKVSPLPLDGKTDEFSGGVGSYKIAADVDKTEVEVNEAITLTVKISGRGNVKSIPEPTLPALDGFRVEQASSDYKITNLNDQLGGTKVYEYLLIPRLPGQHTIDPIILNYFDPGKRKYVEAATSAINLNVNKGTDTTGAEVPYNMVSGQVIDLKETDIRFIKTDNGNLQKRGRIVLTSPIFLAAMSLPLLIIFGGMIDVRRRRKLASDIGYARRRRAKTDAQKRLKEARRLLEGEGDGDFFAALSEALFKFIADKFNVSAHGLTSQGVRDLLQKAGAEDKLVDTTESLIRDIDFGRFAGGAGDRREREKLYERTRTVIVELGEALR